MKSYTPILLLPFLALISNAGLANHRHDGYSKFDQRIERQHKRIRNGVRAGELTKREAKKLRTQHRHIKKLNKQFNKDGRLNRYERRTLQRELDLASNRIYRLKHNGRYRGADSHHRHDRKKHKGHAYLSRFDDHDHLVLLERRKHFHTR